MTAPFTIPPLGEHDRSHLDCGVSALDRSFRQQVTQDVRRRVTSRFVAIESPRLTVAGYYTLSARGVPRTDIADDLARRLPRYPLVPVARLGRLAVHRAFHGRGLGATLLWDAAMRAARSDLMAFAIAVHAKDDQSAAFHRHHGFVSLGGQPHHLVSPLANLAAR